VALGFRVEGWGERKKQTTDTDFQTTVQHISWSAGIRTRIFSTRKTIVRRWQDIHHCHQAQAAASAPKIDEHVIEGHLIDFLGISAQYRCTLYALVIGHRPFFRLFCVFFWRRETGNSPFPPLSSSPHARPRRDVANLILQ